MSFTATQDGKAYLNDDTDHRVAYSTQLKSGQVMRFDPETSAIQIDGTTAPEEFPTPDTTTPSTSFRQKRQLNPTRKPKRTTSAAAVPTVRVPIGIKVDVQPQDPPQPQAPVMK